MLSTRTDDPPIDCDSKGDGTLIVLIENPNPFLR